MILDKFNLIQYVILISNEDVFDRESKDSPA